MKLYMKVPYEPSWNKPPSNMHPAFIKLIDGHDQVGVIEKSFFADTDVLPDHYSMTDRRDD